MTQKTLSSFTICHIFALEINYFPVLMSVRALLARHRSVTSVKLSRAVGLPYLKILLINPGYLLIPPCKQALVWDPRAPLRGMGHFIFSIFRINCAILTSYIRAVSRTCRKKVILNLSFNLLNISLLLFLLFKL